MVEEVKNEPTEEIQLQELLNQYSFEPPAVGDTIRGKVIMVREKDVVVDFGFKIEGIVPIEDFYDWKGNLQVKEGDEIEVVVEKSLTRDGYVLLSKRKADLRKAWEVVEKAFRENEPVKGTIIKKEKKGFIVDIQGLKAFLPLSQVELKPVKDHSRYIGKEFLMKVVDIRRSRNRVSVIVSRRVLIEEEQEKRKRELMERLKEGQWVKGIVKTITDFGVFVDLGGIDGLLPLSEISWGRVTNPRDYFEEGQEIEVLILKFDPDKEKITLGYKQKTPDPWLSVGEKYKKGDRVKGRVVSLTDFGVFVELEEGVEGLIRMRELSWSSKIKDPHQIISVGEEVEVEVLDVKPEERRIALSYKRTLPSPWDIFCSKYKVGDRVKGIVKDIKDFGAFIEFEEGIEGLLRKADVSWERVEDLHQVLKEGEEIEVVILELNKDEKKLRLGRKQLTEDPFKTFLENYKEGDEIEVEVTRVTPNGVFVRIIPGVEARMGYRDLRVSRNEDLKEKFPEGKKLKVKIQEINPEKRKVRLAVPYDETKRRREEEEVIRKPTLGDLLRKSLSNLNLNKK